MSVLRSAMLLCGLVLGLAMVAVYLFWNSSLNVTHASAYQIYAALQQPIVVQQVLRHAHSLVDAGDDDALRKARIDQMRLAIAKARGNQAALNMNDNLVRHLDSDLVRVRQTAARMTDEFLDWASDFTNQAEEGLPLSLTDSMTDSGSFALIGDLHMQARAYRLADDARIADLRLMNGLILLLGLGLILLVGGVVLLPIVAQAGEAFSMASTASRRFKLVIEAAAEGICEVDGDGTVRFLNSAGAEMLGITADEAVGRYFYNVTGWAALPGAFRQSACFRGADGQDVPVEVSFTPQEESGSGGVIVFHGIADQLAREEGLRKLSQAVEHSPAAVLISNAKGLVEYVNPAFSRLSGFTFEEMVGRRPNVVKSGRQDRSVYNDLWSTIQSGRVWRGEFCNLSKDGEEYWVQSSIAPVRGIDGTITHFIAVQDDITADRALRRQLAEMVHVITMASKAAHIGHWRYDLQSSSDLFWSEELFLIHGMATDSPVPTSAEATAFLLPEYREDFRNTVARVASQGGAFSQEARIRTADGQTRWILASGQDETDETGTIIGIVGVIQDISDRKKAEAEAARNARRLRDAVESLRNGFALFDADDRLVVFNKAYLDLHHASAAAITVGASYAEILRYGVENGQYPEAAKDPKGYIARRLQWHRDGHETFIQELPDDRWVLIDDKPTAAGDHVSLHTDITEMKRTQKELKRARREAEYANRAKSEFLSNMSHELRTPLNAILGFGQLLLANQRDPLSPRQSDQVAQVVKGGDHLLALINDILDLAKVEAGGVSLSAEPVQVAGLIDDCLCIVGSAADSRSIALSVKNNAPDVQVWADPMRVRQVLINLLSNAVKYNVDGGAVTIRVTSINNERVQISVEDTGIGIPAENLDQLFQPFNRLGQERGGIEGTGIGLTLTLRLLEAMGGTITVSSEEGKGTLVCIELPAICPVTRQPKMMEALDL